jgi:hypothetical protein
MAFYKLDLHPPLCERADEITHWGPLVQRMRQACAPFSPDEESPSISETLFFIPDFITRTKTINPITLSVINKVLFNVALSTAGRPVPATAIHLILTPCRVKRNSNQCQYYTQEEQDGWGM